MLSAEISHRHRRASPGNSKFCKLPKVWPGTSLTLQHLYHSHKCSSSPRETHSLPLLLNQLNQNPFPKQTDNVLKYKRVHIKYCFQMQMSLVPVNTKQPIRWERKLITTGCERYGQSQQKCNPLSVPTWLPAEEHTARAHCPSRMVLCYHFAEGSLLWPLRPREDRSQIYQTVPWLVVSCVANTKEHDKSRASASLMPYCLKWSETICWCQQL